MNRGSADLYSDSNLIRENGDDIEIILPNEVNTLSIEFILKHGYSKSKKAKGKKGFNFKFVIWIDPFALNILAIWIKELNVQNAFILIDSPNSPVLKHFLYSSGFYTYVNYKQGERTIEVSNSTFAISQYSPMQFFDTESQFRDYLSYLKTDEILYKVFFDLENDELVERGKIRDVILNEIGDNIFTHAKSNLGNALMAKYKPKNVSGRLAWKRRFVDNAPPLEKRFFSELPENVGVIIISIADSGIGIPKTLRQAYASDKKIELGQVQEVDVLEYAFDKYSSSRSTSVRIAGEQKLNVFASDVDYKQIFKPTTGLYKLYSLVQKLKGLIYLRSGTSILTINFLSDNLIIEKSDSKVFQRNYLNKPAFFPGTQFKIIIPDIGNSKSNNLSTHKSNFFFPEAKTSFKRYHIALFNYKEIFQSTEQKLQVQALNKLVESIRECYNEKLYKGIVLDVGIEPDKLSEITKYLQYVIAVLVVSQDEQFSNVMINVPDSIEDVLEESFNNKEGYEYNPLVYFNKRYERNILAVSDRESQEFNDLYKNNFAGRLDFTSQLFQKFRVLFGTRREEGKEITYFVHNRKDIFTEVAKFYRHALSQFIADPTNGVFQKDAKVLLPSKVYCEGFYEVANLIADLRARSWLKTWIECQLLVLKPFWVVSLSPNCNNILDEIIGNSTGNQFGRIKHVKIPDPLSLDYVELIKASQEIGDSEEVILFTDVIGTTKSIINLIKTLSQKNIKEVFTIIDVSGLPTQNIAAGQLAVKVHSIVQGEFRFYQTKPSNWHYHELYFVDKKTNKLGRNSLKHNEPIWTGPEEVANDRDYILALLLKNKIIFRSKRESLDGVKVSCWFDLNHLISEFKDSFASTIVTNLTAYVESENESVSIDKALLIHVREKPDVDLVITSLIGTQAYKLIPNSITLEVFYFRYRDQPFKLNGKTLIFIDDVFTDAEPIFKLLDFCSRNGAYAIFIYYLIKIDNDVEFERLKNIKIYSNVKVYIEYLIDMQLPVYKNETPFDDHQNDLDFILIQIPKKPDFSSLRDFIEQRIKNLEFINVYERSAQGEVTNDEIIKKCVFLQKCKSSLEHLSKLIELLSEIHSREEDVLMYIELLSDEFISEIDDSEDILILKDDLKNAILRCVDFLVSKNRISGIPASKLYSVLYLVKYYDICLLFGFYEVIHSQIKHNEDKLNILTYYLLELYVEVDIESLVYKDQIVKLIEWLQKYSNRAHGNFLMDILNEAINYKREQTATDISKEIIKIRQEFHAINRARDLFGSAVKTGFYDTFNDNIIDLSRTLNKIRRTLMAISSKTYRSQEFNTELVTNINKLDRFIAQLDDISAPQTDYSIMSSELTMLANQVQFYFNPKQGKNFQDLIRALVQDIVPVVKNRIHSYHQTMFIAKNIEIINPPKIYDKLSVFAENDGLIAVLDNIISNILEHSNTAKFAYDILLEDDFVLVRFYDDGISIEKALTGAKKHKDKGLGIITEILSLYDGDLLYKEIQKEINGHVFTNTTQVKFRYLDFN